jgi:hypothetical protein
MIGTGSQTVENIIGADVQTPDTSFGTKNPELGRRAGIDQARFGHVLLTPINVRCGCGIDQQLELDTF